jgi:hypothetical protein
MPKRSIESMMVGMQHNMIFPSSLTGLTLHSKTEEEAYSNAQEKYDAFVHGHNIGAIPAFYAGWMCAMLHKKNGEMDFNFIHPCQEEAE